MRETITISERFAGPPGIGNGGYVSGLLARYWDEPVQVTLRRPAPLARPLTITSHPDNSKQLLDGNVLLAEARPTDLTLTIPTPPDYETAVRTRRQYLENAAGHPFPHCFVCGPARAVGDGLRIFPAPAPGRNLVAAAWKPEAALADETGKVRPEILWAALDCPGGIAAYAALAAQSPHLWAALNNSGDAAAGAKQMRPLLLGQMTGTIKTAIYPNEPAIVIGWRISSVGRKHQVGTALFDATGALKGMALSLWIEPAICHPISRELSLAYY